MNVSLPSGNRRCPRSISVSSLSNPPGRTGPRTSKAYTRKYPSKNILKCYIYQQKTDVAIEFAIGEVLNFQIYTTLSMEEVISELFRNFKEKMVNNPENASGVALDQPILWVISIAYSLILTCSLNWVFVTILRTLSMFYSSWPTTCWCLFSYWNFLEGFSLVSVFRSAWVRREAISDFSLSTISCSLINLK